MSNNIECFWLKFLINVLKMFFLLQKLPSGTILKINILSRLSLSNYLSLDITSNDHRKLLHHCHRITNRKLAKKNTILRSNSQIKSTAEYWFNYFSHSSKKNKNWIVLSLLYFSLFFPESILFTIGDDVSLTFHTDSRAAALATQIV